MFYFIQKALSAAQQVNIKVQLLVGGKEVDNPAYSGSFTSYLQAIASNFSNNSTLYSYDFLNEPGYFHNMPQTKGDVCSLVEDWNNAIHDNSTNHLTTIGLSSSGEVFKWDPGILKLDFLSFHLYPDILASEGYDKQKAIDRVKSEMKWIAETSELPWIIGETGFAANSNDLITYDFGSLQDQKDYVKQTIEFVRDCGGNGYSWWQYQDVWWGSDDEDMGLIDHFNVLKPAISEIINFDFDLLGITCSKPLNYYNFYNYSNYHVSGLIKDQNDQPIENAVIIGWDANWGNPVKAFSNASGQFNLYSNNPINITFLTATKSTIYKNYNVVNGTYLNVTLNKFRPVNDIILNNITVSTTNNYETNNSINVLNFNISSSGSSTMKATNVIHLKSGFHSKSGSYFHAYNAPFYVNCNNSSNYRKKSSSEESPPPPISLKTEKPINPIDINLTNGKIFKSNSILIYPNPSSGIFSVVSEDNLEIDKVEVFNNFG